MRFRGGEEENEDSSTDSHEGEEERGDCSPPPRFPQNPSPESSGFKRVFVAVCYALPVLIEFVWNSYIAVQVFRRYVDSFGWEPFQIARVEAFSGMFQFIATIAIPSLLDRIPGVKSGSSPGIVCVLLSVVSGVSYTVFFSDWPSVLSVLSANPFLVVFLNAGRTVVPMTIYMLHQAIGFRLRDVKTQELARGLCAWAFGAGTCVGNGLMVLGVIDLGRTVGLGCIMETVSLILMCLVVPIGADALSTSTTATATATEAPSDIDDFSFEATSVEESEEEEQMVESDDDASPCTTKTATTDTSPQQLPTDHVSVFCRCWKQNGAFRIMMFLFVTENAMGLLFEGMKAVYMTHVLDLRDPASYQHWSAIFNFIPMIVSSVVMPFWMWIRSKVGLRRTFLIDYAGTLLTNVALFGVGTISRREWRPVAYCVGSALLAAFFESRRYFVAGCLARLYDYDEFLRNERLETEIQGLFIIQYRFISVPGSSIALLLASWIGGLTGGSAASDSNNNALGVQPVQSDWTLLFLSGQETLLPAVANLVGMLVVMLFPISEDGHSSILKSLDRRRSAIAQGASWDRIEDPIDGKSKFVSENKQANQVKFSRTTVDFLLPIVLVVFVATGGVAGYLVWIEKLVFLSTVCLWTCGVSLVAAMFLWNQRRKCCEG